MKLLVPSSKIRYNIQNMFTLIGQIIGGVGLFLVGIERLSRGFKSAAGYSLRRILSSYTNTTIKGVFSGFLVSSAVQSATAVLLTIVGFINSRIIKLEQALKIVYGINLGKITIAWLLVTLGFKFNFGQYALYLLGIGAFLQLFLKQKRSGIATALVGFSLIFLGLGLLKESIAVLNQQLNLRDHLHFVGYSAIYTYFILGFLMTMVMQSSTGGIAINLSLLATGVITLPNAFALIIGQNLGTIVTPILISMKNSPAARRVVFSHIIFNTAITIIGWIILHLQFIFHPNFESSEPGFVLVGLYSITNMTAVLICLAFNRPILKFLVNHFYNAKSLGTAKYIDRKKAHSPQKAIRSLRKEVLRFGKISNEMLIASLDWKLSQGWIRVEDLSQEESELDRLIETIHWFANRTARKQQDEDITEAAHILSTAGRHFEIAADMSLKVTTLINKMTDKIEGETFELFHKWIARLKNLCEQFQEAHYNRDYHEIITLEEEFFEIIDERHDMRKLIIAAGIEKELRSPQTITLFDMLDVIRTAIKNQIKAYKVIMESLDLIRKIEKQGSTKVVSIDVKIQKK